MAQKSIFGKTYGKASKKSAAFSSFDEAIKIPGSMNLKATSKITKWGTLKFTKNGENLDSRKRVFNEDDPFSFEPDKKNTKVAKLSPPLQNSNVSKLTEGKNVIDSDSKYEEKSGKLSSKSEVGPAGASLEAFMQSLNKNGDTTKKIIESTTNHKIFKSRNKSKEILLKDKSTELNKKTFKKEKNDSENIKISLSAKHSDLKRITSRDEDIAHVYNLSDNEINASSDEEKDQFTFIKKEKKTKANKLTARKETQKQTLINEFLNKRKSEVLLDNNNDMKSKKMDEEDDKNKFNFQSQPSSISSYNSTSASSSISSSFTTSSSSSSFPSSSSSFPSSSSSLPSPSSSSSSTSFSSSRKFLTGETKYKSKYKAKRWWEQKKIENEKEEKNKNDFLFGEEKGDFAYDEDDEVIGSDKNLKSQMKKNNGGLERAKSGGNVGGDCFPTKDFSNNKNNNNNENKNKNNNDGGKIDNTNEDDVFKKPSTTLFFKTKYGLHSKKNHTNSNINLDRKINNLNCKSTCKNYTYTNSSLTISVDKEDEGEDVLKDKVIRDVKQAHECHESGESQEFKDDLDYLMDGLAVHQTPSIRCLSLLSLLSKCRMASFRMHLRAHVVPSRIFALFNVPLTHALELCSSCLFLFITSDRLSTDLDQSSFSLLLKLIQSKPPTLPATPTNKKPSFFKSKISKSTTNNSTGDSDKDYIITRDKIYDICSSSSSSFSSSFFSKNNKSLISNLTLQKTTTALIGTEALVRYLSKKDVKLHRDLLVQESGLKIIISKVCEHIRTVESSSEYDVTKSTLEDLNVCLHALENISHMHEGCKDQMVEDDFLLEALCSCVVKCCCLLGTRDGVSEDGWVVVQVLGRLDKSSPGYCLFVCLLASLNIFINLSHDHRPGSEKLGQCHGLVEQLLKIVLILQLNNNNKKNNNSSGDTKDNNNNDILSNFVNSTQLHTLPSGCKFDLAVLSLGLLINIVEDCDPNIERLLEAKINNNKNNNNNENDDNNSEGGRIPQSLETLSFLFTQAYNAARDFEEQHDAELERKNKRLSLPEKEEDIDDVKNDDDGDDNKDGDDVANVSGEWVESELGVEWVAKDCTKQQSNKQGKQLSSKAAPEPLVQDVNKALRKAGKHMEDTILAAYSALLIGCILQKKPELVEWVRGRVPDRKFKSLSRMITKIYNFMNITQGIKPSTSKSILKVLKFLETIQ